MEVPVPPPLPPLPARDSAPVPGPPSSIPPPSAPPPPSSNKPPSAPPPPTSRPASATQPPLSASSGESRTVNLKEARDTFGLSDAIVLKYHCAFRTFDVNNDGVISLDDLAALYDSIGMKYPREDLALALAEFRVKG